MLKSSVPLVRIFDENYQRGSEPDYEIEYFAGQVPGIGDRFVSLGTIYEVTGRIFLPNGRIGLVTRVHEGEMQERLAFLGEE